MVRRAMRAFCGVSVLTAFALLFSALAFPEPTAAAEKAPGQGVEKEDAALLPRSSGDDGILDSALDLVEAAQECWVKGDEQQSIGALDRAYALLLEMNTGDPKAIQSKDDLRFTISKRLMEIYASRRIAAKGNHREIPLTRNKYVDREIRLLQGRERRYFIRAYLRSGRYRTEIVKALKDAGLPVELSWLPLIESGFKPRAKSPARALGLWQFVPSTGRRYGLRRNRWIDERLDPVKSTNAAIAYLTDLHEIFGDWATVLAAYNCGEGAVLRAISRQKKEYLDEFWDLYQRLPYETARYFPRFLAVLTILKDPARYGFTLEEPPPPASYEEIAVKRSLPLRSIARKLGIGSRELADLNPELRRSATPPAAYSLKVPAGKDASLLAGLDVRERSPSNGAYVFHRVASGETLSHISARYNASVKAIMEMNNIGADYLIRIGQKLKIPLDPAT